MENCFDVNDQLGGGNAEVIPSGMQARAFQNLTGAQVVAKVGPLFTADQKSLGFLHQYLWLSLF